MQSLKLVPICIFALVVTRSEMTKQEILLERGINDWLYPLVKCKKASSTDHRKELSSVSLLVDHVTDTRVKRRVPWFPNYQRDKLRACTF